MSKRKSQPVFLPVFLDKEGKSTFLPFRLEQVDESIDGKNVKTIKPVAHEPAKDKYGEDYVKPMNRAARRIRDRQLRLSEKRYGPRQMPEKKEISDASSISGTEGNSLSNSGTKTESN